VLKRSRLFRTLYYVGPLLLWMGFIFTMSTDNGSAAHTRPVVNSLLRRLWPTVDKYLSAEQVDSVDWGIRKCAHVTEYAILGILASRAVAFGNPPLRSRKAALPLLIGVLYALSDEYHQSFVPSRGASIVDVFFDSFGVVTGVAISRTRFGSDKTK
jgi:VanZ family protein